ncbi:MAG: polysulfide reductase NrfD [Deltaproteobacteria bacterium]|nr:polysulfide reductase NrfD [Deltaproteobacteria bacterium]
MILVSFVRDCVQQLFMGGRYYWSWIFGLNFFILIGLINYFRQYNTGLILTGMSDQVSWGFYVSNFTYLVGIAAAAVMLVIPAYIFNRPEAKKVVLLGEGLAVAASLMCILFVTVDMGRPDRLWHMLPFIGRFNWPMSLLTWDVIVLSGYLLLNLFMPLYILFHEYSEKDSNKKFIFIAAVVSMFWAISIHTVTAFLFASNPARPFWHSALLAPKFLASAFTAGPAFIILAFRVIDRSDAYRIGHKAIDLLAAIVAIAMQVNLLMLVSELFTEFYSEGTHSASARYLFFGLHGFNSLVPWIYTSILMNIVAAVILMVEKWRRNNTLLSIACVLAMVGVWIEKGMGFVIPGFIPTPIGEVFEYGPTWTEIFISLGIWCAGLLVFTILVKAAIPIQRGRLRYRPE